MSRDSSGEEASQPSQGSSDDGVKSKREILKKIFKRKTYESSVSSGRKMKERYDISSNKARPTQKIIKKSKNRSTPRYLNISDLTHIFNPSQLRRLTGVSKVGSVVDVNRVRRLVNIVQPNTTDDDISLNCTIDTIEPHSSDTDDSSMDFDQPLSSLAAPGPECGFNTGEPRFVDILKPNCSPVDVSQPSCSKDMSQPSSWKDMSQPSCSKDMRQPSCSKDLSQPSCSKDMRQPSCSKNMSQPSCSKDMSQPSCSKDMSQPSCSKDMSQPSCSKDMSQPSSWKAMSQPSCSKDMSQPSSWKAMSKPSCSKDMSRPSSWKDMSQPSSWKDMSQPSSWKDMSQPQSHRDTCKPAAGDVPLGYSELIILQKVSKVRVLSEAIDFIRSNPPEKVERILGENSVIFECKVCRFLSRGLRQFLLHKRHYCTGSAVPSTPPQWFMGSVKHKRRYKK